MSDAKGDLGRDFLVAKAKHLRDQLAAATARAEKAERELRDERMVTSRQADRIDVLAADCETAERERDDLARKLDIRKAWDASAELCLRETERALDAATPVDVGGLPTGGLWVTRIPRAAEHAVSAAVKLRDERDALRAENERLTARVGVLREAVGDALTLEHVSQPAYGEVRDRVRAVIADPDRAAAERDARLVSEVREAAGKQLVSICSTYGVVVEIQSGLVVVRSADPLRETKAKARDDALQEAVRELERQAQGWRNARTSSDHAEETAEGYDAAAVVVQALLGKAGTT